MLECRIEARRLNAHRSLARCKDAEITLDTDVNGRPDAFNPAEFLLAALAACMIKGIERVVPMLRFELRGVEVAIWGVRQDKPPRTASIEYKLTVDTNENDERLALLHRNVMKFGTVYNTLLAGTRLAGVIQRAARATAEAGEGGA